MPGRSSRLDEDEGLETAPRRQTESVPESQSDPDEMTASNPTDVEAMGHQRAMNTRGAEYDNQNLYNEGLGPNYLQAGGEQEGAYVPPKTAKGDPYRDPAIIGATHSFFVPLAKDVISVRTGTPLKAGPEGWTIAGAADAVAIAQAYAEGGTRVPACKLATLETYERQFKSGDQVGFDHVDDRGAVVWSKSGPFTALSDTQVLVDLTRSGA